MFDNLTKEIIYYSLIPVFIIAVLGLIFLIVSKLKKDSDYKYNYIIKVILLIIIGLVLPLIIGYSLWRYNNYLANGTITANIGYLILLLVLVIILVILLITISVKLYRSFKYGNRDEKIDQEEYE